MVRHMVHRMVNDMMHGMVHGMVLAWCASHGVRQAVPRTEVGHVDRHAVHIHAVELAARQLQRPHPLLQRGDALRRVVGANAQHEPSVALQRRRRE